MNEATPQLAANPAGLHYLNSIHGVYLHDGHGDLAEVLPLAALNSVTSLSAEVTGRAYGGGVLKMEPREAAKLLVPSPSLVRERHQQLADLLPHARALLLAGDLAGARTLVDGVLLVSDPEEQIQAVRDAHAALSDRRRARTSSRAASRGST